MLSICSPVSSKSLLNRHSSAIWTVQKEPSNFEYFHISGIWIRINSEYTCVYSFLLIQIIFKIKVFNSQNNLACSRPRFKNTLFHQSSSRAFMSKNNIDWRVNENKNYLERLKSTFHLNEISNFSGFVLISLMALPNIQIFQIRNVSKLLRIFCLFRFESSTSRHFEIDSSKRCYEWFRSKILSLFPMKSTRTSVSIVFFVYISS